MKQLGQNQVSKYVEKTTCMKNVKQFRLKIKSQLMVNVTLKNKWKNKFPNCDVHCLKLFFLLFVVIGGWRGEVSGYVPLAYYWW